MKKLRTCLVGVLVSFAASAPVLASGIFINDFNIHRSDLSGSLTNIGNPGGATIIHGIAADPASGKVYWGSAGPVSPEVWRSNFDGSSAEKMFAPEDIGVTAFSVLHNIQVVGDQLYFGDGELWRSNFDGTGAVQIVASMSSFRVDGSDLYYSSGNQILRSELDGSAASTVIGASGATGDLAVAAGKLVWATSDGVGVADLDGSNQAVLAPDLNILLSLTALDDTVYVGSFDAFGSVAGQGTWSLKADGSELQQLNQFLPYGMDAYGPIPEPGAASLLLLAIGLSLVRRRAG